MLPAFSPGVSPSSAALAGGGSELGRAGIPSPGTARPRHMPSRREGGAQSLAVPLGQGGIEGKKAIQLEWHQRHTSVPTSKTGKNKIIWNGKQDNDNDDDLSGAETLSPASSVQGISISQLKRGHHHALEKSKELPRGPGTTTSCRPLHSILKDGRASFDVERSTKLQSFSLTAEEEAISPIKPKVSKIKQLKRWFSRSCSADTKQDVWKNKAFSRSTSEGTTVHMLAAVQRNSEKLQRRVHFSHALVVCVEREWDGETSSSDEEGCCSSASCSEEEEDEYRGMLLMMRALVSISRDQRRAKTWHTHYSPSPPSS